MLNALLFVAAVFAAERFTPGSENNIKKDGVLLAHVAWIKDKGQKFDFNLHIHNENEDKGMIIFLSDLRCKRGTVTGVVKHTFFNTGEKTIDFKPNERKDFNLVCRTEGTEKGDFQLKIAKVYDNPSLDGKTVGKVIAENLEWKQSDRKE